MEIRQSDSGTMAKAIFSWGHCFAALESAAPVAKVRGFHLQGLSGASRKRLVLPKMTVIVTRHKPVVR
jgi:hypothetical protein